MKYLSVIVVVMALAVSVNSILDCDCSCFDGTNFSVRNATDTYSCYKNQLSACPRSLISKSNCTNRPAPALDCDCSCYDGTHFNVYNASDANACNRKQSQICPRSAISRSICTARTTPTPQPTPQPFCDCFCFDGTHFSVANAASPSSCYLKQYQLCPRSTISRSNCTTPAIRS